MAWSYNSRRGEFAYPRELPELPVSRITLLKLGKSGVLFAQFEILIPASHPSLNPPNTTFRYHGPYLQAALAVVDTTLSAAQLQGPLTDFAASQTEQMSAAINTYCDNLFEGAQQHADGRQYISLDQALGATGLSYPKLQQRVSSTKVNGRPTWDPKDLARAYAWNIPGTPETQAAVLANLSDLAASHVVIHSPELEEA